MQESGEYLYSVGDVGVGSVFGENDVLVCAVVVQVDTVAVKERVQSSGEWCCSTEGALFMVFVMVVGFMVSCGW